MKKEIEKSEEIIKSEELEKNEVVETTVVVEEKSQEIEEIKEEKNSEVVEEKVAIVSNNKEIMQEAKQEDGNKVKFFIISIAFFIIVLLFLSTIFAVANMNNTNIIKGVYIEETEVSNMSSEEVEKLVSQKVANIEEIKIYYKDYEETIKLEDIGFEINSTESINKAISEGRSNNIIIDNYNVLKALIFKTKHNLDISINQEKFDKTIKNIEAELPGAIKQYSYEINKDKLIIKSGVAGEVITKEEFEEAIIENITNQFNGIDMSLNIPTKYTQPEEIDIEKIYSEVYKEAKDAYIIEKPFEFHKEENGIDFAISIEEAKQIISESKKKYTIPLKITKPKIQVKDLGDKLFKQTLAKYTTIYDAGDINRGINIGLAAKAINGTILLPGETFSYNGKIGDTTKEKGYRTGGAYVGGKVVQAYGGGICQLSSTLYNAVLYANLGIVERYNHSYAVGYVPAGRDATVSYGGKDFKFKNTRSYPIKIVASAKNGVVSVTIKGIKEEKEYEIVLTSSVLSVTPCGTTYEKNSNMLEGKEKVIQNGYNGKKSIAYKIVKYNGKTISKTVLSKDTYKPMNRIVEVGTKKVETTPTVVAPTVTTPTTTPEPTTQTNSITTNNTVAVN